MAVFLGLLLGVGFFLFLVGLAFQAEGGFRTGSQCHGHAEPCAYGGDPGCTARVCRRNPVRPRYP